MSEPALADENALYVAEASTIRSSKDERAILAWLRLYHPNISSHIKNFLNLNNSVFVP